MVLATIEGEVCEGKKRKTEILKLEKWDENARIFAVTCPRLFRG